MIRGMVLDPRPYIAAAGAGSTPGELAVEKKSEDSQTASASEVACDTYSGPVPAAAGNDRNTVQLSGS